MCIEISYGCSKSHCVFSNRWCCPRLFVCERDMNVKCFVIDTQPKNQKKVNAIRSSFVLAIVIRT